MKSSYNITLENLEQNTLGDEYEFINGLHFIKDGVGLA